MKYSYLIWNPIVSLNLTLENVKPFFLYSWIDGFTLQLSTKNVKNAHSAIGRRPIEYLQEIPLSSADVYFTNIAKIEYCSINNMKLDTFVTLWSLIPDRGSGDEGLVSNNNGLGSQTANCRIFYSVGSRSSVFPEQRLLPDPLFLLFPIESLLTS